MENTNETNVEESIITDDESNGSISQEPANNEEVDLESMSFMEKLEYLNKEKEKSEGKEETEEEEKPLKDEVEKPEPQKKEAKQEKTSDSVKVKINGEEKEVKIEELVKSYQKGLGADQKFLEASTMRKQAEKLIDMLKSDPLDVLERMGLDVEALAEDRLYRKIQFESMTPEEQEAYINRERLKNYEEQERIKREQEKVIQYNKEKAMYADVIMKKVQEAIDTNELPKEAYVVKKFMTLLKQAYVEKIPVAPADLVPLVKEELELEDRKLAERYKKADVNKLINELGEDKIKEIQKHLVSQLKNPYQTSTNSANNPSPKKKTQNTSLSDWKKSVEHIIYGG